MKKFKQLSKVFAVFFAGTFLQIFWAMWDLRNHMSSACMSCSFGEEAVFSSLMFGFFLTVLFFFLNFIKTNWLKNSLQFCTIAMFWFAENWDTFITRESSWSTYTRDEEMTVTLISSFFPIVILGGVCVYLANKILDKK